jgi:hypothetical protein
VLTEDSSTATSTLPISRKRKSRDSSNWNEFRRLSPFDRHGGDSGIVELKSPSDIFKSNEPELDVDVFNGVLEADKNGFMVCKSVRL